jgi:hypothetical protein
MSDSTCHSMPEPTDRNMSESTRLHLRNALVCLHVHACWLSALTLDPVQPAQGDRLADRLPRYAAHTLVIEIPLPSISFFHGNAGGRALARACRHGMRRALCKADGLLTTWAWAGPATGNAILAGPRHESRIATSRGCRHPSRLPRACAAKGGQQRAAAVALFSPNLGTFSFPHVVVARRTVLARGDVLQEKVSPRRWDAHEQQRYLNLGGGNDAGRPRRSLRPVQGWLLIVPAGPRRRHTSIRKLIAAGKSQSKDAPFRRCRAPALLAQRSGDTLVCARAF